MINADELLHWLRNALRREELAQHLESLLADESLSDDLRLLHFAHGLWPQMPPIWRGISIDAGNFVAMARAARNGAQVELEWLRSLIGSGALEFFAGRGHTAIRELADAWQAARSAYAGAWSELTAHGAPADAMPDQGRQLVVATLLAFDADHARLLRERAPGLLDPVDWLLRAPWFLRFGSDVGRIALAQLEVLHQLDEVSRIEAVGVAALTSLGDLDVQRVRSGVMVTTAQRRLLGRWRVEPGAEVIVLVPGQAHRAAGAKPFGASMFGRLWRSAARQWGWIRRAFPRIRPAAAAAPAQPQAAPQRPVAPAAPEVEVRMVRVQPIDGLMPVDVHAFAARISWRADVASQHKLIISTPSTLPRITLGTHLLPPEGQILLLLAQSCRIRISQRVAIFRSRRTAPIDLFTRPPVALSAGRPRLAVAHAKGMLACAASPLHAPWQELATVPDTARAATAALHKPASKLAEATSTLLRPQGGDRATRLTPQERRLAQILIPSLGYGPAGGWNALVESVTSRLKNAIRRGRVPGWPQRQRPGARRSRQT